MRLTEEAYNYLYATGEMSIQAVPSDDEIVESSADGSFSAGGGRSRTGVVVLFRDAIVHWASQRQTMTSLSSCESEIHGACAGVKLGLGIRQIAEELRAPPVMMKLSQGSVASMRTLTQ